MKDIEILLRGFAMLLEGEKYKPSLTKFLNNFSRNCKNLSAENIKYLENLFHSFLESCSELGDKAFIGKAGKGKFNISIYESVFSAICKTPRENKALVLNKIDANNLEKLKVDIDFTNATQFSIASKANVNTRISRAMEILL